MFYKKPFVFIVASSIAALLLTGCTSHTPVPGDPDYIAPSSSQSNNPTSLPTDVPTPAETGVTSNQEIDPISTDVELETAQQLYPDVEGVGSFTKEQTQLAYLTARTYIQAALTKQYYLDGSFVKSGSKVEDLESDFKRYFLFSSWDEIKQRIATDTINDDANFQQSQNTLAALVYAPGVPDNFSVEEICSSAGFCVRNGAAAVNFTDFGVTSGGDLYIKATAVSQPIYLKDGVRGHTTVTYNYYMTFAENPVKDFASGNPTMAIKGLSADYNVTAWEKD